MLAYINTRWQELLAWLRRTRRRADYSEERYFGLRPNTPTLNLAVDRVEANLPIDDYLEPASLEHSQHVHSVVQLVVRNLSMAELARAQDEAHALEAWTEVGEQPAVYQSQYGAPVWATNGSQATNTEWFQWVQAQTAALNRERERERRQWLAQPSSSRDQEAYLRTSHRIELLGYVWQEVSYSHPDPLGPE